MDFADGSLQFDKSFQIQTAPTTASKNDLLSNNNISTTDISSSSSANVSEVNSENKVPATHHDSHILLSDGQRVLASAFAGRPRTKASLRAAIIAGTMSMSMSKTSVSKPVEAQVSPPHQIDSRQNDKDDDIEVVVIQPPDRLVETVDMSEEEDIKFNYSSKLNTTTSGYSSSSSSLDQKYNKTPISSQRTNGTTSSASSCPVQSANQRFYSMPPPMALTADITSERRKPVLFYDKSGELIIEFASMSEAVQSTFIPIEDIIRNCQGFISSVKSGCFFKYKIPEVRNVTAQEVVKWQKDGFIVVRAIHICIVYFAIIFGLYFDQVIQSIYE